MVLLKADLAELVPHLEDRAMIAQTLEALSLRKGETYVSLGVGRNLLPLIIALQGLNVVGVDIDPSALEYQRRKMGEYAGALEQAHGSFDVYNFNFDDHYGTKHIPGFDIPDYNQMRGFFDVVECVFFNHREGGADLAQILLNLAKPGARFFVSAPGGQVQGRDRTAHALINATASTNSPQLEVVAAGLYVSTSHSNHYGVVLKPNS